MMQYDPCELNRHGVVLLAVLAGDGVCKRDLGPEDQPCGRARSAHIDTEHKLNFLRHQGRTVPLLTMHLLASLFYSHDIGNASTIPRAQ